MVFSIYFILFFKGVLVGFIIAAPVGPIGILCIRRTLGGSYALGLATGLGAGLADTFYGAVAGFSLASVADFIKNNDFYLRLFGGILLGWIGFSILRAPPRQNNAENEGDATLLSSLTSAFLLTVSNPLTLIVFAAAFAAMGIAPLEGSFSQAFVLVAGVFVGANAWWLSLSTTVHLMHHKLSDRQLLWINRSSGVLLCAFSAYMLLSIA
ncbi:MAG: LysE family transporter [Alphaproteobacteria bacterium]|nr:LysE family transporter [Alphaproteobacteria bacterium]